MYHYVMQVIGGRVVAHGAYKSSKAAENRYDRVEGGEIHLFRSDNPDAQQAIQEFRDEEMRRL